MSDQVPIKPTKPTLEELAYFKELKATSSNTGTMIGGAFGGTVAVGLLARSLQKKKEFGCFI